MKKKLLFIILTSTLLASCIACGSSRMNDTSVQNFSVNDATDATNDDDNPYSIIDNFISKYNVASDNQITNISILDIRASDYRVEYRLNAFKNAVGEKGFIGNTEIQIVNYGVYANDSLRFYFTIDTADVGTDICYNIVRLLDDSVPYDDFVNAFSSYDSDPVHNVRLDFDNITIASGSGNEIMIDCTKID